MYLFLWKSVELQETREKIKNCEILLVPQQQKVVVLQVSEQGLLEEPRGWPGRAGRVGGHAVHAAQHTGAARRAHLNFIESMRTPRLFANYKAFGM